MLPSGSSTITTGATGPAQLQMLVHIRSGLNISILKSFNNIMDGGREGDSK